MELTLEEAATRLGKSVRQIRYLVQQGRLRAGKRAGRWFVHLADLPDEARQAKKQARLRAAVEGALDLAPGKGARRYSLRDLRAFQLGLPLYQQAVAQAGEEHPAAQALSRMLAHLARGCHRFDNTQKAAAYQAARDEASLAACELLVRPGARTGPLVDAIEQDLMAALAGLLRRADAPRRRAGA